MQEGRPYTREEHRREAVDRQVKRGYGKPHVLKGCPHPGIGFIGSQQ